MTKNWLMKRNMFCRKKASCEGVSSIGPVKQQKGKERTCDERERNRDCLRAAQLQIEIQALAESLLL
jgi:hypothetical protein